MILILGLGNPGEKYENTRHNVGFLAIDKIARAFDFSAFSLNKNANSLENLGIIQSKEVALLKPQTYMNKSGRAAKAFLLYRKLPSSSLIVLHDDIDIPFGEARAVFNRGSAGHRGIDSIIEELGTQEFWRVRIGVLPPEGKPQETDTFVLRSFDPQEQERLSGILEQVQKEVATILTQT
ncbi:MAG: aminoacyl-tRNA hydrolase [bacterium]|nr:aminoacyl-tRNA hydrolase [bacterium]